MRHLSETETAVVGAGPAGLLAAAVLPRDFRVLIFERNTSPGRKLLLTGSGQCNLTHTGTVPEFGAHYGKNGKFLLPALYHFPPEALLAFFRGRGLDFTAREDGKVFPASLRAQNVLEVLLDAAGRDRLLLGRRVREIEKDGSGFLLRVESGGTGRGISASGPRKAPAGGSGGDPAEEVFFRTEKVVLTTGGLSYPATGSSGDGFTLAASLGHTIVPPRPALAGVVSPGFGTLAGNSFSSAEVSLYKGGRKREVRTGGFLFTHRGVSGPAVLDLARCFTAGDLLEVNFLHPRKAEDFLVEAAGLMESRRADRALSFLAVPPLTRALAEHILAAASIPREKRLGDLRKEDRRLLAEGMVRFRVPIEAVEGFDSAMATAGGVALSEVNPKTMESRLVPGLFFAGEVLDVDGDSGGYNLQAAFSTGALAGKNAVF